MEVTARHLNEVEAVQHVHLTVPSTVEIDRTSPVIDPKARYWSRIAIFALTLHSTPPLRGGDPRRNIANLPQGLVRNN